jgi:hypothetical protein
VTAEAASILPMHMPGSPGYREATAVFDTFATVQPDEAVIADSAGSVAAAITRARSRGLDVEVISYLAQARTALAPWDTGSVIPTFVEDRANPGRWMDPERAAFVDLIRRDIDPGGLFRRGVWPPR